MRSLNSLAGWEQGSKAPASAAQIEVLTHLEDAVRGFAPPAQVLRPEEAAEELLGPGHPYDQKGGSPASLGVYDPALISIPSTGSQPVDLCERLPSEARKFLVDYEHHLLLNDEEWGHEMETGVCIHNYWDPVLKKSRSSYEQFVRMLHQAGMIAFTKRPLGRTGVFFVKKKNGKLRMVLDCRSINRRFRRTPHIPMGTGSTWADVVLDTNEEAWFALSDLQDYFYSLLMPEGLMSYFCLDAVNDAFLGTLESPQLLGDPGLAGEWSPCLKMVPMGWSWSFFFAQIAHSAEVQTALDLPAGCLLVDRRPAPVLAPGVTLALPYCDNLTVATTAQASCNRARLQSAAHCRKVGYKVHEEVAATQWAESLGFVLDGLAGRFSGSPVRGWKLRQALRMMERRPSISGAQMEKLLGHVTFYVLPRRELLSALSSCYAFVRERYHFKTRLWRSAASECRIIADLLPLITVDWKQPWADTCFMTDASPSGFGVMEANLHPSEQALIGAFDERWRFRHEYSQATGPRASALGVMDPFPGRQHRQARGRPGARALGRGAGLPAGAA